MAVYFLCSIVLQQRRFDKAAQQFIFLYLKKKILV